MNSGSQITRRAFIQTTAAAAIAAPLRAASTVIPSRSPAPMHAPGGCDARGQKRFPIGLSFRLPLPCVVAIVLCFGIASSPPAQAADQQQKLESLLRRFPEADLNKDGKLTIEEAKAYSAAHPELRRNRQADAKGKAGEADEGTVSAQVLALYEAREFKGVNHRLLKPIDLAKNPDQKYPLILSLHGAGGIGNDNVRNLREWCMTLAQEELRRKHPCFVVAPQTFGFWRTPAMAPHYTDENIAKLSADWQATISGLRPSRLAWQAGGRKAKGFILSALRRADTPLS